MSTSPFVLLPSSHARIHDTFPEAANLEQQLRAQIRGEVRFDAASKALYATDGSNYRHIPIGVVIPRDEADVIATVAACRAVNAPILSRGAGTSLAGQGCNTAVILDFSKYMNGMDPIDTRTRTVHVQPGIVLDRVRDAAEKFAFTFAPDPATHSRCTIGGMIGNNSCGVHALMGGKTVDNILSLDLLLYDGTRLTVGPTTEAELAAHIAAGGRIGEIYAALKRIRDIYADQVRAKFPRIPRRVSGFNLDELLPENNFNLARALVGSEGTCAVILGATLQLVESPPCRTLVGVGFPDIFLAADNVPEILEHKPIGLEGVDGYLLDALRRKQKSVEDLKLLPPGDGFLIVEFGAATQSEANAKARAFVASMKALPAQPTSRIYTSEEARRVWHIRESGLGATAFIPGPNGKSTTGWEGWEDAAVDPLQLGSYLRGIHALIQEFNYSTAMYGHFGQGCVHMRLSFDLETPAGILKFREFIDRAADIALAHGGSLSGEHGDGQARAELLPKMFGPELIQAFNEFKSIWDPDWRMNPGKVVEPYRMDENLRHGPNQEPSEQPTHFKFPQDHGSLAHATLRCVGVGKCRRYEGGVMCPSFRVTREEEHSTRGRAHLLWEMTKGEVIRDGWQSTEVKESLDLCLSCKGCKSDCPVSVDLATYKAEFLSHYYEGKVRPLNHYAFGNIDFWAHLASAAPGLVNLTTQLPFLRDIAKLVAGIPQQRTIPAFAPQTFKNWFRRRAPRNPGGPAVVLWPDTFNNYFLPATAKAAVEVLESAGFEVLLPEGNLCCGRPLYDFGLLERAERQLLQILDTLTPEIEAGIPIVGLEPSCVAVFRDELCNLFPHDDRAQRLSRQVLHLSEFLECHKDFIHLPRLERKAVIHGHCHHKAIMKMSAEESVLRRMGVDFQAPAPGCCGMAGSFGFEDEHYDVSMDIGELELLPAVRKAPPDWLVIADGFSCREQIAQGTDRQAFHLAEILQMAIRNGPEGIPGSYPERYSIREREAEVHYSMRKAGLAVAGVVALSGLLWGLHRRR